MKVTIFVHVLPYSAAIFLTGQTMIYSNIIISRVYDHIRFNEFEKTSETSACKLIIVFTFGDLSLASLMQHIDGLGLAE
jgi:hypothetical protein